MRRLIQAVISAATVVKWCMPLISSHNYSEAQYNKLVYIEVCVQKLQAPFMSAHVMQEGLYEEICSKLVAMLCSNLRGEGGVHGD